MLTYIKNGKMVGNKIFMDPHIGQDEKGNSIYNTKEYYKELAKLNNGLVKGFFEQNSVDAMETNYIGSIGHDENGRPNRSLDHAFVRKYKQILQDEKVNKRMETVEREQNKRAAEDNRFRDGLIKETNSPFLNSAEKTAGYHCQSLEGSTFMDKKSDGDVR